MAMSPRKGANYLGSVLAAKAHRKHKGFPADAGPALSKAMCCTGTAGKPDFDYINSKGQPKPRTRMKIGGDLGRRDSDDWLVNAYIEAVANGANKTRSAGEAGGGGAAGAD